MKVQQYAEALFEASRHKSDAELALLAERMCIYLKEKGHFSLLPAIVRELEKITRTRGVQAMCTVRVAQEKDLETFQNEIANAITSLKATELPRNVIFDNTLIGGYEVRAKGVRFDRTYKRSLLNLYTTLLTNNT